MLDGDFYNLASKLEYEEHTRKMQLLEATTMSAISFIPAHMGVVKSRVKKLAKTKQKWGMEILEDDEGNKDVRIEDALRIIVPKEHWDKFQEMFQGELNNDSYLNLSEFLNEAIEDDIKNLRDDLKPSLLAMFGGEEFATLDKTIHTWQGRFGIKEIITNKNNVLIKLSRKGRDIQKLSGDLLHAYQKDKGGLELILNDIKTKAPLSSYNIFKKYGYLYGSRIASKYNDVLLILEAVIDMSFMASETIYIDDEAVLDAIEDEVTSIKRVGNVIYPANDKFDVSFFATLQNMIDEVDEEDSQGSEEDEGVNEAKLKEYAQIQGGWLYPSGKVEYFNKWIPYAHQVDAVDKLNKEGEHKYSYQRASAKVALAEYEDRGNIRLIVTKYSSGDEVSISLSKKPTFSQMKLLAKMDREAYQFFFSIATPKSRSTMGSRTDWSQPFLGWSFFVEAVNTM